MKRNRALFVGFILLGDIHMADCIGHKTWFIFMEQCNG